MKKYFLIILTMAVAYAFSSYAGTSIFVANTPMVNRGYLADLQNQFKKSINTVYLAFSFKTTKTDVKKDIAVVYPTLVPYISKKTGKIDMVTATPTNKTNFAKVDPATIPDNLFKSISKGVSAYEEKEIKVFKVEKGTTYKIGKIKIDGKEYEIIDISSK